jgi:hypothetical protein
MERARCVAAAHSCALSPGSPDTMRRRGFIIQAVHL